MLRGTRIGLRPIREADLADVYQGYSNLEARGDHYPHDLES